MSVKQKNLISIITVTYNAVDFIEETIKSVINQTYKNIEFIVIDGGSVDGTLDIIKKYENQISYWISEPDKGIYDAMNKGINYAHGEWLNFLNAGDSFVDSSVLEKIFVSGDDVATLIYGDIITIEENDGEKKPHYAIMLENDKSIRTGMNVCHQAIFYHKSIIELYDTDLRLKSEWKHLIQITRSPSFEPKKLNFPIVYYRKGGLGAKQLKLNQKEYREVFLEEYGRIEYIKYIPFFIYMSTRRILKNLLS